MVRNHPTTSNKASFQSTSTTQLHGWFKKLSSGKANVGKVDKSKRIHIVDHIGSGSYGTVHEALFIDNDGDDEYKNSEFIVAKRAWTFQELRERELKAGGGGDDDGSDVTQGGTGAAMAGGTGASMEGGTGVAMDTGTGATTGTHSSQSKAGTSLEGLNRRKSLKEKAKRCKHYLNIEYHCLKKMQRELGSIGEGSSEKSADKAAVLESYVPTLLGRYKDDMDGNEWLVFERVTSLESNNIARSLKEVMNANMNPNANHIDKEACEVDDEEEHVQERHHMYTIQKELGMDDSATLEEALDKTLKGLLEAVVDTHKHNIVHRDIKPDNLLIDGNNQAFRLIDFGSAADMDAAKKLFDFRESSVALSPVYAAPECFIEWDKAPLNFDVFSVALVFCQLLFNLLDDRTDVAFRRQLTVAEYDLDLWLECELEAELSPTGIEAGLYYLGSRPGLWGLLKRMLKENPKIRVNSSIALSVVDDILAGDTIKNTQSARKENDGAYFDLVLEQFDICTLPEDEDSVDPGVDPRPLHFVASFDRKESIGLILSEVDAIEEDPDYEHEEKWTAATAGWRPGDVFIRDIVEDGQAEGIGIFDIGDRIAAVGEIPCDGSGFEGLAGMLGAIPDKSKTVRIHFDRRVETSIVNPESGTSSNKAAIISQHGAWSTMGRRQSQEDAFIMHEIKQVKMDDDVSNKKNVLLMGVFDGHGGDAASKSASQLMPSLFTQELKSVYNLDVYTALEHTWEIVCDSYRDGCSLLGEGCIADYDSREGILYASIGASDLIAGTTASVAAIDLDPEKASDLIVLNCGDSRTLVVGEPIERKRRSFVHFNTRDHVPGDKLESKRLRSRPEYSDPQCSMNKSWMSIGEFRYSLSRSLEGSYATEKGIVSEPDMYRINLSEMATMRSNGIILQASDGLFEVMDNEEVAREVVKMRKSGMDAKLCAKTLCDIAVRKCSSDNVSVNVVFVD